MGVLENDVKRPSHSDNSKPKRNLLANSDEDVQPDEVQKIQHIGDSSHSRVKLRSAIIVKNDTESLQETKSKEGIVCLAENIGSDNDDGEPVYKKVKYEDDPTRK